MCILSLSTKSDVKYAAFGFFKNLACLIYCKFVLENLSWDDKKKSNTDDESGYLS